VSLTALLDWLGGLDPVLLNAALGLLAFVENVFPPIPADVVAAFGSFVAAREGRSPLAPFLAVWLSNVAGAMFMYFVGSRLGRTRVEKWLRLTPHDPAEKRFEALYGRFGTAAFFLSRFIPGVRAIVPPFAGALHIAPFKPAIAIALEPPGSRSRWVSRVVSGDSSVGIADRIAVIMRPCRCRRASPGGASEASRSGRRAPRRGGS